MPYLKKNLFIYALVFFSIIISTFIWKKLNIPYNSDIIGEYSLNNYNSLNDIIKYLVFVLFPVSTFILAKVLNEKINILNRLENLKIIKLTDTLEKNTDYLLIFFLILILLEFFSINWPIDKLDIFHSGQSLYPAFRYDLDGSLWSEIYIIKGVFLEIFTTKISWDLTGFKSIGASRASEIFLILITKINLIFLMYEISKGSNLQNNLKTLFFLTLCCFSIYLINYNLNSADLISYRDLPILFSLYLYFSLINNYSKRLIKSFLLGLIFVSIFFWGIDRAIVNIALTFFIVFNLLLNKKFKELIILFLSIIFCIIFFYFLFNNEFKFFLQNTFLILKEMTNIHGLIHPIPFSSEPNASRATKTLILIIISMIVSLNLLLSKNSKINNNFIIILVSISLLSFFSYIYAIGRSDGGHIRQASGYPLIFIFTYLFFLLIKFGDKFQILSKFFFNRLKIFLFFFILLFIFGLNLNFNNIINFKSRLSDYVKKDDLFFLTKDDVNFVSKAKSIIQNFDCIQLYTNDSALLYLLRKQSCSKYYWPWSYGSEETQRFILDDLKNTELIISNGITDSWGIPFKIKFKFLDPYIKENFSKKIINIGEREIRFKN